jgi:glutathione S-transferase
MAGLAFHKQFSGYAAAPKGKLPYIDDDGVIVADSAFIRLHIEQRYGVDLDANLSPERRAITWSTEKMVEDQLYWGVHTRWAMDANFELGPAHFFDHLPEDIQAGARQAQRRAVLSHLHGQGFGRHSPGEIAQLVDLCCQAAERLLGRQAFLGGGEPCGADASLFVQSASLTTPAFESPARDAVLRHPELVAFSDRMLNRFFPDHARR